MFDTRIAVARHVLVTHRHADHVSRRHEHVAPRQEDDRPLRVFKPLHIDQERHHSRARRDETQDRPQPDPEHRERPFLLG